MVAAVHPTQTVKVKFELVRVAVLASHAAASHLAAGGDRATARLLRAAEALARSAVASLNAAPSPAVVSSATALTTEPEQKSKNKRRRVKKKKGKVENGEITQPSAAPLSAGLAMDHAAPMGARWVDVDAVGESPPIATAVCSRAGEGSSSSTSMARPPGRSVQGQMDPGEESKGKGKGKGKGEGKKEAYSTYPCGSWVAAWKKEKHWGVCGRLWTNSSTRKDD